MALPLEPTATFWFPSSRHRYSRGRWPPEPSTSLNQSLTAAAAPSPATRCSPCSTRGCSTPTCTPPRTPPERSAVRLPRHRARRAAAVGAAAAAEVVAVIRAHAENSPSMRESSLGGASFGAVPPVLPSSYYWLLEVMKHIQTRMPRLAEDS